MQSVTALKQHREGQDMALSTGPQSTGHLLLIEPEVFYANPETMDTNVYQAEEDETQDAIFKRALAEFRGFRDMLVENRVAVTTVRGETGCPDHLFPNWISTHTGKQMIVYPMLNDNRRKERSPAMMSFFESLYETAFDFTSFENESKFLESTGSLCIDRVNGVAYAALSGRTTEEMVRLWSEKTGYDVVIFETESHTGKPVYHTDLVMWIGTEVAAICADCIKEKYRADVLARLRQTHEVIELSLDELKAFCGNSLEILNADGDRMLVMSEMAYHGLAEAQKEKYRQFFTKLLYAPIPTIEKYGGGSARCLIMELF
ncbi:MAG: hypothetical protein H6867_05210 [Rhodospirillales bacterium]|nr:hypothetical protein [Rhodospirillales bacterium]MCB9994927.1 hypothetical protein [Rhodospirillales bacterium]